MWTKFVSLSLIFCLLAVAGIKPVSAQSKNEEKRAQKEAKVKKGIKRLDIGEEAKVKIKLFDKTKFKGSVQEAGENDFTIVENKTGAEKTISYAEVKEVSGKNMSLGIKILIGVGIGIAATLILFEIIFHKVIDN